MKAIRAAFEGVCMIGLAFVALAIMLLAIPLTPYFFWKWRNEEREGRMDAERQLRLSRGGYYDHP